MGIKSTDEIKKRLHQRLAQHGIDRELLDSIVEQAMTVSYPAGAVIFLQGSSAEFLIWLLKGVVKVYCPIEGERILARLAGPGELLGQVNFLNGNGRRQLFESHAASKCEVAVVSRDCILRIMEKLDKPEIVRLLDALNTMWSEVVFWYVTLLGLSYRTRLEMVLKDLASRFGVREKRGMLIIPELSQLDLAEMIGSSRPMVSRLVKEMTERGELLRYDKKHIISDQAEWLRTDVMSGIFEPPNGKRPSPRLIVSNFAA